MRLPRRIGMSTLPSATSRPAALTAVAAGLAATGLLLVGCSAPSAASHPAQSIPSTAGSAVAGPAQPGQFAGLPAGLTAPSGNTAATAGAVVRIAIPGQQISYTANLTVRTTDVSAAAVRAVGYVTAAGGYVSSEQQSTSRPGGQVAEVSLEFKIPAAQYAAVLPELRTRLGTEVSFSEQALDLTQQVADVSSRVTSAPAAIAQLRALLRRAGSVSDLLAVPAQVDSQESDLESLLAQQQALAHETSYATVSMSLVSTKTAAVKHPRATGGFAGGLKSGWHALVVAVTWLLTALGAALPFAIPLALLLGLGYLGRRLVRRRTPPAEAG